MIRSIFVASVATLALGSVAQAQNSELSVGAGYDRISVGDFNLDSLVVRGNYDFSEHFGIEAQANIGVGDDTVVDSGVPFEMSLNYAASLFGVFRIVSNESGNIFVRAGYTTAEYETSAFGFSVTDKPDAWAYGVGGEYLFDARNGLRFDYTSVDYEGDSADVYGITYVRHFGG
tara:strand:+ start:1094 stop:1615 length:522 start_codon:yes stop_codon:yes gene_type:complete